MNRPTRTLNIIGMYASGYTFGDLQLFIPMDTFRDIYGVNQGISWVFVRVDSVDNVASVTKKLQEVVGDVADILAPKGAAVFTATTSRTVTRLAVGGAALAVVLMTIVIFFVTLMQVRERSKEIGTLKAIGASDGGVTVEVLTEATALTILGGLVALILFRILGEMISGSVFAIGITPFLPSHYKPLVQSLSVSNQISASGLGGLVLIAFLASVIGSAYGLWQVIKLSPLEAMKHE
ncbi:MAG: FtsX-like permease family protein [Deltaproteobacteria bacterium]|nr:FtsX-like permease family protein [Deltaproteobacteria bacterium]